MTIYTFTANPTRDRALSVPELQPGTIHRAQVVSVDLGGKGINVSRGLHALGIDSVVLGFVAGAVGHAFREGLTALGIAHDFIEVDGETRQNITLYDEATGVYTKFNEPGSPVRSEHLDQLYAQAQQLTQPGDIWVLSGSLPPGAPTDLYAQLIERVQARGGRALLDSSRQALAAGLAAKPFGVKPNSEETADILERQLTSDADHAQAVSDLLAGGSTRIAAITRGADGLVLAVEQTDKIISAVPPQVEVKSTVGAGDATLTGIVWGLVDNCDAPEIARRAVACGTAAAMQEGTLLGDRPLIESLLPGVTIKTLNP